MHIGVDDGLRLRDGSMAGVQAFLHDLAEIIHTVEEHVIQFGDLRLDVAWHREVDHQNRSMAARLDRAFDHSLAQDRQRAGRAGDYDVVQGKLLGQVVQRDCATLEAAGKLFAALDRTIGESHFARLLCGKVGRAQFDHFTRADKEYLLLGDARVNALGNLDRRRRHRHGAGADVGPGAHLLRHRKRGLEQLVQHRAECAGVLGGFHRVLHLAEDLRLADHHRIEPARHAEGVGHRALARQRIKERLQGRSLQMMEARKPVDRADGLGRAAINLGAITGGNDRRFAYRFARHEIAQRDLQILGVKSHLLANRERGRMVVHAESEELHRSPQLTSETNPDRGP